ncbi:hypothetical protein ACVOMV_34485 [Mesorhizobium atlanticum]
MAALRAVAETIAPQDRRQGRADRFGAKAFLTAYYGELRAHLERKLLFGNRKVDEVCAVASLPRLPRHLS